MSACKILINYDSIGKSYLLDEV